MPKLTTDIAIRSKKWHNEPEIEQFVKKTCQNLIKLTELETILSKNSQIELSISLVADSQIKKLNKTHRNKDKATNVLSFCAINEEEIHKNGLKNVIKGQNYLFLGDIVLAYDTIKKEAASQKKDFYNHLTHLILHSILHLIGYDHEEDKMAEQMEKLEVRILEKLNINNPYQ